MVVLLVLPLLSYAQFNSAPAFPGAEGYGRYTTGGRGGTVYHVTTLEDYCDNTDYSSTKTKDSEIVGSLRYAVKKSGARIIVFDVAGTIELKAPLKIQNDNITILGQTAPGDGICLKNFTVGIFANNVIIRYIRCRLGNDGRRYYSSGTALSGTDQIVEDDAMNAYQKTGNEKKNIIIDHCSVSWSVDECGSFYGNQDFTLQWCLLTESLKNAGHTKGNHGYGGIWGGERASFHHNMLANHDSRNPRFDHGYVSTLAGPVDYTNNVLYNWGGNSAYGGENKTGEASKKFNMINNYYRYGGATSDKDRLLNATTYCTNCASTGTDCVPGTFYISGNYMYGSSTVTNDNTCSSAIVMDSKGKSYEDWKSGYVSSSKFKATTQDFSSYNTISLHTAEKTYDKVLQYAGASYKRDAVDTRVCNDAKNGTTSYTTSTGLGSNGAKGGLIDQPSDVGGYPTLSGTKATDTDGDGIPDEWEDANGLDKNSAADATTYTLDSRGYYQNIEVYANSLVETLVKAQRADATETFEEYYPTLASAGGESGESGGGESGGESGGSSTTENTLTWDYTEAAPSSSPDNGLTYAASVNDAEGTNNGLKGIKLNSSGYCYFTKDAVAGTLAITFSPRSGSNAASISVYSYTSTPSAETLIGTTETTTSLDTKTIELTATQNNIYLQRGANTETVITKIIFTPAATEEPSQGTSHDKTLGSNTYTIASGDQAVSGTKITGTDITMTYGDDTWKDAATESTHPTDYTYFICGTNSPSPSNGQVPTTGCYYKFEPTTDGTLNIAMLVNASKNIYVVENGTSIDYSIGSTAYSAGSSLGAKTGDILSFPVTSGKTYYVYCAGSKLGLFGWTLTSGSNSEPEESTVTPVTVSTKKAFNFIVGKDGDADAAIAAANAASGSDRYYIFVPDGTYDMTTKQQWTLGSDKSAITGTDNSTVSPGSSFQNNATWLTRSNVSIIGQSENGTKLRNTPTYPGISYTSTLEIRSGKTNTYIQDLTLYNNYANGANDKGVAVAFYDRGTNTILKNVNCWSNQDTYTSAATRCYYENSTFAGTVDFICGGGDVWFEKCDLVINDRSGNVITAPATASTENWGYVFNSCTISKAAGATKVTDKNWNLGRPWKNSPAATFINTTMNVLPKDAGWTNMNNGLVLRFHEYGSKNSSGTALDLSSRSISACSGADTSDNPVLTAAQAATYTVDAVVGNNGAWSPKSYTAQVAVSNVALNGSTLSWDNSDYALCWVVFKDGEYYANPTTNSLALTESGSYTVRAANAMGGLGEASSAVSYIDDTKGTVAATVKMTYVDGSNTTTSYGEVTTANAGYNNISNNNVGLANSGWNCNWITYIKVDASNVPAGRYIKKATLTAKVSGSTDSKRTTTWGAGYNSSTWSSTMTYENTDRSITTCGNTYTTSTKSATTFEDVEFDISDALVGDADKIATILIYETAAAGGYIKDVAVSVEYTDEAPATPQYTVSASSTNGTVTIKNGDATVSNGSKVDNGTQLTFTATPATGYKFTKWSDDNTDNPRTVTVNGDNVSLSAEFEEEIATATATVIWDFSKYTDQITLAGDNVSVEYSGLTLVGNTDPDYTGDYVKSTAGFHCNGKSSTTTRYIKFTPTCDGVWKVTGKGNGKSATRIIAIGTSIVIFNSIPANLADGVLAAAETSDGSSPKSVTIEANLTAGTTYYAYFAEGGSSITKLEYAITTGTASTITATVASSRTFGSFSSIYNVDFSDADCTDEVKAYTVKFNATTNTVNLTRYKGVLPAGTGVVLYAPNTTKSQAFSTVASTTATVADNDMVGTPVATTIAESVGKNGTTYYNYGLYEDTFHPLYAGTIAAGKAYLSIPYNSAASGAKAIMLYLDDENATGIETLTNTSVNDGHSIYNLQGIKVATPVPGKVYIINGKKFMMK